MTESVPTRVAFSLILPRENIGEYQTRHSQLWPELRAAIREQGGSNYSIFAAPELDRVFGYLEVEDLERWQSGAASDVTARWWSYMADLMPTNADSSPIGSPLFEVFHQE
jgi:L-rhamnose mutarotase